MRNSFINKVTRVHKAVTVANSTNLSCPTILVVFLEFFPIDLELYTSFSPCLTPAISKSCLMALFDGF